MHDDGEGDVAAGLRHAGRVGALVNGDRRQNIVDGDGGVVVVAHRFAVVVSAGGGRHVGVNTAAVAGHGNGESAFVEAASGDSLRQGTGSHAIQVAVNGVGQAGDVDAVHRAGVVHADGEGDRASRLAHARRVGGLGD